MSEPQTGRHLHRRTAAGEAVLLCADQALGVKFHLDIIVLEKLPTTGNGRFSWSGEEPIYFLCSVTTPGDASTASSSAYGSTSRAAAVGPWALVTATDGKWLTAD